MNRPRILRRPPTPAGRPDEPAPPPAWLAAARAGLNELILTEPARDRVVEAVLTVAPLLAGLEVQSLPVPWVAYDPAKGDLIVSWESGPAVVQLTCRGRMAAVTAMHIWAPVKWAMYERDRCGAPFGELPPAPLSQLRNAIGWLTSASWIEEREMFAAASGPRHKAI